MVKISEKFWHGKRVLVTGHTGFKGSWLSLWLKKMQANVTGYALPPASQPDLFSLAEVAQGMTHIIGDVKDYQHLQSVLRQTKPEIVIHMAAQSLVRQSYLEPVETYAVNVMGTVNLFEAIRSADSVRVIVNVTSDKCYENNESGEAFREQDSLGGFDPYSSSKACAELITAAWRNCWFHGNQIALSSVRAGNVIGGGDWAADRLIPDIMRASLQHQKIKIRYPDAIRPWQHVLDPLYGYLLLAEKMYENPEKYAGAWNFGPAHEEVCTVQGMVKKISNLWGGLFTYEIEQSDQPHEATYLKLDCTKAKSSLGWHPQFDLSSALQTTIDWFKAFKKNQNMKLFTEAQINDYQYKNSGAEYVANQGK